MKKQNTYRNINPTATGICPGGIWSGTGVLCQKGSKEII